jgi:hypothetical protein
MTWIDDWLGELACWRRLRGGEWVRGGKNAPQDGGGWWWYRK